MALFQEGFSDTVINDRLQRHVIRHIPIVSSTFGHMYMTRKAHFSLFVLLFI